VTKSPGNAFTKCFLLLLLLQQGMVSLVMAAPVAHSLDGSPDVVMATHDCQGMGEGSDVQSGAKEDMQSQEHQDCIESGCDSCVGCVAGFAGSRPSGPLYLGNQPLIRHTFIAASARTADLLYRPPIKI